MVEQGTHQGLLSNTEGAYHNLVNAQQLEVTSGEEGAAQSDEMGNEKSLLAREYREAEVSLAEDEDCNASSYRPKGLVASVGLFLYEQRSHYPLYFLVIVGAMVAGGKLNTTCA